MQDMSDTKMSNSGDDEAGEAVVEQSVRLRMPSREAVSLVFFPGESSKGVSHSTEHRHHRH